MTASASIGVAEIERFRGAVRRRMGLHVDDSRLDILGVLLHKRSEALGISAARYLVLLEGHESLRDEVAELAPHLTVSETYFFRHHDQFQAFAEIALPARFAARSSSRHLSLLSAGCSSGDEAYSLAILARERMPDRGWEISVRGVDINPVILQKAARGRYARWAFRETSREMQARWFHTEGDELVLDPSIHRAVTFEQRNLIHDNLDLWQPETYDIVFCRNMLMYFSPEHAHALVTRIARALVPGGYLFLGHAETLRGLSHDFHLRHTHETFYYQRKSAIEDAQRVSDASELAPQPMAAPPLAPVGNAPWIHAIDGASQRIFELGEKAYGQSLSGASATLAPERTAQSVPAVPDALQAGRELTGALQLLREERFAEGLHALDRLEPAAKPDADEVLLRAALLTHSGQHEQAERACRELLALDDLSAGAHYLLALCREGLGDADGALEHYQAAVYLDPGFAMPHLHLGLLARRAADRETARRELAQALSLLQREDAARILLFGGGFKREALLALCRSQLLACGVKA